MVTIIATIIASATTIPMHVIAIRIVVGISHLTLVSMPPAVAMALALATAAAALALVMAEDGAVLLALALDFLAVAMTDALASWTTMLVTTLGDVIGTVTMTPVDEPINAQSAATS